MQNVFVMTSELRLACFFSATNTYACCHLAANADVINTPADFIIGPSERLQQPAAANIRRWMLTQPSAHVTACVCVRACISD